MMLACSNEPVPSYKSYKNDKFDRYSHKQKSLITGIKQCSLKEEDKIKLLRKLKQEIDDTIQNINK